MKNQARQAQGGCGGGDDGEHDQVGQEHAGEDVDAAAAGLALGAEGGAARQRQGLGAADVLQAHLLGPAATLWTREHAMPAPSRSPIRPPTCRKARAGRAARRATRVLALRRQHRRMANFYRSAGVEQCQRPQPGQGLWLWQLNQYLVHESGQFLVL